MSDWVASIGLWYSQRLLRKLLEKLLRRFKSQNDRVLGRDGVRGRGRKKEEGKGDLRKKIGPVLAN